VQVLARGLGQVEVGEDAAGTEEGADFAEELALAVVLEVVDGEAGDDRVELPVLCQPVAEVVDAQLNGGVAAEALGGAGAICRPGRRRLLAAIS